MAGISVSGVPRCTIQLYDSCFSRCPPIIVGPPPPPSPNMTSLLFPPCRAAHQRNWTCVQTGGCPVIQGLNVCPVFNAPVTDVPGPVPAVSDNTVAIAGALGGVLVLLVAVVAVVIAFWYRRRVGEKKTGIRMAYLPTSRSGVVTELASNTLPTDAGAEVFYHQPHGHMPRPANTVPSHPVVGKPPDIIHTHSPHLVARQGSNSSQRPLLESMQGQAGHSDTWSMGASGAIGGLYGASSVTSLSNGMSPNVLGVRRRLSTQSEDVTPPGELADEQRAASPPGGSPAVFGAAGGYDATDGAKRGIPLSRSDSQTVPRGARRMQVGKDYSSNWEKIDEITTMKRQRSRQDQELVLDPNFAGLSGFGESEDDGAGATGPSSEPEPAVLTADQLGLPGRNPYFQPQYAGVDEEDGEDGFAGFGKDEGEEDSASFGSALGRSMSADSRRRGGDDNDDDDDGTEAII